MGRSLAATLIDFSARPVAPVPELASPARDESALARAHADGFRDGHAVALAKAEAAGAAHHGDAEAMFEIRLAEARKRWADDIGSLSAERIDAAVASARDTVAASVARALVEVAALARRPAAVDALAAQLSRHLTESGLMRLNIFGPPDLLHALSDRFGGQAVTLHERADAVDLRAEIDGTILETTLVAWRASLLDAFQIASDNPP